MTRRHITADHAASILYSVSFPDEFIVNDLLEKVEHLVQTMAGKRNDSVFYMVPLLYAAVPAYSVQTMVRMLAEHLRDEGYYVKEMPDGRTLWISWKYAFKRHVARKECARAKARLTS